MIDALQPLLFGTAPIRWLQQALGLGWPLPFRAVSQLGTTWGVIAVFGLSLWLWGRETLYAMAALVVLEAVASVAFNLIWSVPRPSGGGIVKYEHLAIGAFPSGHVFAATLLRGGLAALRRIPHWTAAAIVAGVAIRRLYLGVHYLGDVLGAAALALPLLWLWLRGWPPVRRWLQRRPTGFFYALAALALAGVVAAAVWWLGSNPFMWNAAGVAAGAAVALPLEARRVGYAPPARRGWRRRAVAIGLAGILPLLLIDRLAGEDLFLLGAAMMALGTLWVLWLAPALLRHRHHQHRFEVRPCCDR